jgi:lysostaphin
VFVRAPGAAAEQLEVRLGSRKVPTYPDGPDRLAALAISPDPKPGTYRLEATAPGSVRLQAAIRVLATAFPVQRLKMAPARSRLYDLPEVRAEDERIGAVIRTRSDERIWCGDWLLPVSGRFSTGFGVRRVRNGKPVGRHRGIDIAAPRGQAIVAPAAGRVVLRGEPGKYRKYGGTIVLDHGQGLTSLYIHMSRVDAAVGDVLDAGDPLGAVGDEGVATGPHLHWAVYLHGDPLEPRLMTRLSARGVRWAGRPAGQARRDDAFDSAQVTADFNLFPSP